MAVCLWGLPTGHVWVTLLLCSDQCAMHMDAPRLSVRRSSFRFLPSAAFISRSSVPAGELSADASTVLCRELQILSLNLWLLSLWGYRGQAAAEAERSLDVQAASPGPWPICPVSTAGFLLHLPHSLAEAGCRSLQAAAFLPQVSIPELAVCSAQPDAVWRRQFELLGGGFFNPFHGG